MITREKQERRQIDASYFPADRPDFKYKKKAVDKQLKQWIINWIDDLVKNNKAKDRDLLPSKVEMSNYFKLGAGTIQSALRSVEDEGYIKSIQKVGTMITLTPYENPILGVTKSISKRDKAAEQIKRYIIENNIQLGEPVPPTKTMSLIFHVSTCTIRQAYDYLCYRGFLKSKQSRGITDNWTVEKLPKMEDIVDKKTFEILPETLVISTYKAIKNYVAENCEVGGRVPGNEFFAVLLKVSLKTIHDAFSMLEKEGVFLIRRGSYGTTLVKMPTDENVYEPQKENSIFAPALQAEQYLYQVAERKIAEFMNKNCKVGDRLPNMKWLAEQLNYSVCTVRLALLSMAKQGYVSVRKGRFGGVRIIDMPLSPEVPTYKWLAVNSETMSNNSNNN